VPILSELWRPRAQSMADGNFFSAGEDGAVRLWSAAMKRIEVEPSDDAGAAGLSSSKAAASAAAQRSRRWPILLNTWVTRRQVACQSSACGRGDGAAGACRLEREGFASDWQFREAVRHLHVRGIDLAAKGAELERAFMAVATASRQIHAVLDPDRQQLCGRRCMPRRCSSQHGVGEPGARRAVPDQAARVGVVGIRPILRRLALA